MSSKAASNKHENRSARTRERFIEAAQKLYAERSIDSVSLNEITVAAGQKNRNALQYHFGSRDGLLQAIVDKHADRVFALRRRHLENLEDDDSAGTRAARALVMPLVAYIDENPEAIHYVKILSQLAARNSTFINPASESGLNFQNDEQFSDLVRSAVAHLKPVEVQRRLFLAVSITFHSLADVCRAAEAADSSRALQNRPAMFAQVVLSIERLLNAPALDSPRNPGI